MPEEIPDPTLPRYGYIQPRPFDINIEPRAPLPKQFHMDQFFGHVVTSGGGPPIEFLSGYVVCTRHGLLVNILTAVVVADDVGDDTILRISDDNPDYPVVDGISSTEVALGSSFTFEEGASGDLLYVSLALNHFAL